MWLDDTSGNRDVYFKKSTDNGKTFGNTINLSNRPGGSLDPQMVVSDSGSGVYVVWEHTPGNNGQIFFTRSTDNGASFDKAVNIGNNTGFSGLPHVAASETSDNVYVVWHDSGNGLILRRSTDNGASFENPITLSEEEKNNQEEDREGEEDNEKEYTVNPHILSFRPQIVAEPGTNNVYVVWHSGFTIRAQQHDVLLTDVFFTRSTDNGASFENPITLSNYSGWAVNPRISVSGDRDVYVAWQTNDKMTNGSVVLRRSTDNGASFDKAVNIGNNTGFSGLPDVAASETSDNVYVVWHDSGNGIILRRSTDNGASFENPIMLSNYSGWAVNPRISVSGDRDVYVAWNDKSTPNEEIIMLRSTSTSSQLDSSSQSKINDLDSSSKATAGIGKSKDIALIERTFTDAAYNKSFYLFYFMRHDQEANITRYTDLLYSKLIREYHILPEFDVIANHLKWLAPESNITIITDSDAHDSSSIFMDNGVNRYDVIILGHNEYVTQQEYDNLRQFVANGGTLFILDGNVFYAEVEYDKNQQSIRLVKGHNWAFDGESAWPSVKERWANETSQWVGSNYLCCFHDDITFGNNPFGVGLRHNEEQYITNAKAKIILDYNATENEPNPRDFTVATYEFNYKKGKVITMGLYTDDLLFKNDRFKRFFDTLFYYYVLREDN